MADIPTVEEIQKLRVVDLRERLSKLGLPTSGLKADLVSRLHGALIQQNEEEDEEIEEEEEVIEEEEDKNSDESGKEQSLLDKQKEALALEQVRLLEREKVMQQKLMEEERERQERLEEQKERAMARVQQKMIAREEEEKTILAHHQHQMLEQQKIMEEQKKEQELMQLQQQALIEKTIELGVVPQSASLTFSPVENTMVISPAAPQHPMSLAGPPVGMVMPPSSVPVSVSMVPTGLPGPPPVSMVNTIAPMPPPVSMINTIAPMPPVVSMAPSVVTSVTMIPKGPPVSGPPPSMTMGMPLMSIARPPMPMSGPPQPQVSMGGLPQPPVSMGGPPQPPVSMGGPPQPPIPMSGPPQPPVSMGGPPPMSMAGPLPMSMAGPPPMTMSGPPPPQSPMGGPPKPPMPMAGPPQPPMSMAGPPQQPPMSMTMSRPPMSMSGPPMPMSGPPPPPPPQMSMQRPPQAQMQRPPQAPMAMQRPPMNMAGPPPGGVPPGMMASGGGPPMAPPPGPPSMGMMMQGPQMMHMRQPMHQQGPMQQQQNFQRPPMHQGPPSRGPPMVPPPPPRPPTNQSMPSGVSNVNGRRGGRGDQKEMKGEIQLPQAIEKALQYKSQRAQQLGMEPGDVHETGEAEEGEKDREEPLPQRPLVAVDEGEDDDMEDEDQAPPAQTQAKTQVKESKNVRRKKKKRARQHRLQQEKQKQQQQRKEDVEIGPQNQDVEIVYVSDKVETNDPFYFQFLHIFEKFKLREGDASKEPELTEEERKERARQEEQALRLAERKKPADIDDKDDDDDDFQKKEEEKPKLSKRKLKKLNRMSIAELKQKVTRPELVEMHDVTAKDPVLLLHLKAARNSVPVPRHWCFKRKYLQGKRGIEKAPFDLPEFIKRTGIMEMRQALQEKEEQKTMKAKMRERVRPKMGKIDIDYQKLHDAFFKWQIKPRMTIHGDIYYEGKEFETRLKEKKPGDLSDDLRVALGMPVGQNAQKCPPPWLIAMQRYGPPPSYPNLKIPGLNAPIPEGCSFGYHAGGWGKPPVDETGRPLYGDVFGTQLTDLDGAGIEEEVDRSLWGELESESSEESEVESSEEEEKGEDETGLVTPAEGLVTPSGLSSVPAGMETPDIIELRKRKIEAEMEGGDTPALYTILPEKQTEKVGGSMMGSTHIYDMSAAIQASRAKVSGAVAAMMPPDGVEVTLDPSELEMDQVAMAARYEQTVREQQSQLAKEDLSDMVAEHAARQKNKRRKQQQDSGKAAKKYKEFKF